MLDHDAGIMKDAAAHFWFDVPVTPYASPLRGLTGSLGAMPLRSDADRTRTRRLEPPADRPRSYEARLRSQLLRADRDPR